MCFFCPRAPAPTPGNQEHHISDEGDEWEDAQVYSGGECQSAGDEIRSAIRRYWRMTFAEKVAEGLDVTSADIEVREDMWEILQEVVEDERKYEDT